MEAPNTDHSSSNLYGHISQELVRRHESNEFRFISHNFRYTAYDPRPDRAQAMLSPKVEVKDSNLHITFTPSKADQFIFQGEFGCYTRLFLRLFIPDREVQMTNLAFAFHTGLKKKSRYSLLSVHNGKLLIQKTVISRQQYEEICKEQGKNPAPISSFVDSSCPIEKLNEVEKKQIDQEITIGPGGKGVWCNIFNLVSLTWIIPISRVLKKIGDKPTNALVVREQERNEEFSALEEATLRVAALSEEEIQEIIRNQGDSDKSE